MGRTIKQGYFCALLTMALGSCQANAPGGVTNAGPTSVNKQPIIGGDASLEGEYPSVVALVVDGGRRGLCTATLVSSEWILTAAHCISPKTLGYASQEEVTADTLVVFDTVDIGGGDIGQNQIVQAEATFAHPDFDEPGDVDIGLVKLSRPITDREPSGINFDFENTPQGVDLEMVGYGLTDPDDQSSAGRQFNLDQSSTSCARFGADDDLLLCLNSGVCSGDSGGPSYIGVNGKRVVAGIASFADQGCQFLGAYMRTDAQESRDFIADVAPELLCSANGSCEARCGMGDLPLDPDCATCESDIDCSEDDAQICDNGLCVAAPFVDGAIGSSCGGDDDLACLSGVCAEDSSGGICTRSCDPGSSCPGGFTCTQAAGDQFVCWPEGDSGGCRMSGGTGLPLGFSLLFLGLVFRRRRSRQA